MLKSFLREEAAPTMVEYGLMLALIVLVAVVAIAAFGNGVSVLFMVPPSYFE